MMGISNSNFAGNMGMGLNPSLFVGSPYRHELNLVSGDFFIDNDYIYLESESSPIKKTFSGEPVSEDRIKDYYSESPKNAFGNVFLRGPSYIRSMEKFSWGFHTAFRGNVSATDVPYHVAKFLKEGFDYIPQHDIRYVSEPFRSAFMTWAELGGTYGKKLYEKRDKEYLAAAVTLKFIAGFQAAYVDLSAFEYELPNSDTLLVYDATGTYGHALAKEEPGFAHPLRIRGYGGGVDLGLTYYRGRVHGAGDCNESAEGRKKYKYRVGFSLIDLGFVSFGKESDVFSFSGDNGIWPGIDTVKFDNVLDLDTTISYYLKGGDGDASRTGSSFKVFLPSAVSIQFDYCIMPRLYANATWVQAIPLSKTGIVRASQIAVTPRYETRKLEISIPLVLYDYKHPHAGLAVRYRIFVLGTDRIGSFTGLWDTTGYDLYFGFKLNVCELRKKGGKEPFCPVN
jgi:hypothetical protein